MNMALGLGLGLTFVRSTGGTPAPSAVITAVAANGYTATSAAALSTYQPGTEVLVTRQGYDGSYTSPGGVPTPTLLASISETFKLRHQIRNAYPDDGSEPVFSTTDAALSDYFYSTDSATGCTNNSAEASPKPTCGWAITDRRVVGNSINLQLVAFHRNARSRQQVPCVLFSATDGTTTVYSLVVASSVLTFPGGVHPISGVRSQGFETDLDITSLSDNADITVNAKVYPWIGGAASIADSSTGTNQYDFAPLIFRKNTAKAANPPLVYVASTGTDAVVDANGASGGNTKVSTTTATAKANAFATLKSALEALKAATNVTGGFTDGCEVRLVDATAMGATNLTAGTYQQTACVTITRDPTVARADCALTIGTAIGTRHNWLRFADVKVVRGANVLPTNAAGTAPKIIFENADLDNGGFNSAPFAATWNHYYTGVTVTNSGAGLWSGGSTNTALIRGCQITSGTLSRPQAGVCIGNAFSGSNMLPVASVTQQATRMIAAFNKFTSLTVTGSLALWTTSGATLYSNSAIVGNLFEYIGSVAQSIIHASADGATFNLQNLIFTDNTIVGAMNAGRVNFLYDETIGTYRNHKLACVKRNVFSTWTTKTDYFIGLNGGADAAESVQHTGVHNIVYGVGIDNIHAEWPDANAEGTGTDNIARRWAHYGPYTYGENSSVPTGAFGFVEYLNDARFKDRKGVTYAPGGSPLTGSYTAGAGGGDYRPTRTSEGDAADSPLLGKVTSPGLRFDLAGTARADTADTIGAYA